MSAAAQLHPAPRRLGTCGKLWGSGLPLPYPPTPTWMLGSAVPRTPPGSCQSVGLFVADAFYLGVLISTK